MKAIFVKYVGPRGAKGSTVRVRDGDGNRMTFGWDDSINSDKNKENAVRKFAAMMHRFTGCRGGDYFCGLVNGWVSRGEDVWVYEDEMVTALFHLLEECQGKLGKNCYTVQSFKDACIALGKAFGLPTHEQEWMEVPSRMKAIKVMNKPC